MKPMENSPKDKERIAFFDLIYLLKYEFGAAMMEMQNEHRDGLHFTRATNVFVYRKIVSILSETFHLSPSKVPRHRPKHLDDFYAPSLNDDDGRMKKYVPKKKPVAA